MKQISHLDLENRKKIYTVFPRIVSAETILFWKLKCGNYSSNETIQGRKLLICCFFVSLHYLNSSRTYFRFCSFHNSFQLVKLTPTLSYRISANSFRGNYSFLEVGVPQSFKGGNYCFILLFVYIHTSDEPEPSWLEP